MRSVSTLDLSDDVNCTQWMDGLVRPCGLAWLGLFWVRRPTGTSTWTGTEGGHWEQVGGADCLRRHHLPPRAA